MSIKAVDGKEYLVIRLDNGLYNAGVLGLIKLIDLAGADYIVDGQELAIDKAFFAREDLAERYLDLVFAHYENNSRFKALQNTDFAMCDDKRLESFDALFKGKTQTTICANYGDSGFDAPCKEYAKITKKECYNIKRELGSKIQEYLSGNPALYRYLVIGDSARAQMSDFFGTFAFLKVSQGSYLIKPATTFEAELNSFLFSPLKVFVQDYSNYHNNDGKVGCIQCREISAKNKNIFLELKFLNDFVDSPDKKKSVFWDKENDSCVCPLCALVYSLIPFGFVEVSQGSGFNKDKLFVNENDSVLQLKSRNGTIAEQNTLADKDKLGVINTLVMSELERRGEYELNNIELIARENNGKRSFYSFAVIGKDLLELIAMSGESLRRLTKVSVKLNDKDYLAVFPAVLNNILAYNNQWPLIDTLLRAGGSTYAVNNVFEVQVNKTKLKEEKVKEIDGKIKSAKYAGKLLKDFFGVEAENKLRGFLYKLINSLSTGNRDTFLDSITRMYSGINKEIPGVLINVFADDEAFKEIGYAFVLGLKSEDYEKKEDK